jgi:hypothetical protein
MDVNHLTRVLEDAEIEKVLVATHGSDNTKLRSITFDVSTEWGLERVVLSLESTPYDSWIEARLS